MVEPAVVVRRRPVWSAVSWGAVRSMPIQTVAVKTDPDQFHLHSRESGAVSRVKLYLASRDMRPADGVEVHERLTRKLCTSGCSRRAPPAVSQFGVIVPACAQRVRRAGRAGSPSGASGGPAPRRRIRSPSRAPGARRRPGGGGCSRSRRSGRLGGASDSTRRNAAFGTERSDGRCVRGLPLLGTRPRAPARPLRGGRGLVAPDGATGCRCRCGRPDGAGAAGGGRRRRVGRGWRRRAGAGAGSGAGARRVGRRVGGRLAEGDRGRRSWAAAVSANEHADWSALESQGHPPWYGESLLG